MSSSKEIPNPLLDWEKPIVGSVVLVILLMALINVICLFLVSPLAFQRLGSLWVATIILTAGFIRVTFSEIQKASEGRGIAVDIFTEKMKPVLWDDNIGWGNYFTDDGKAAEFRRPTQEEFRAFVQELEDRVVPNTIIIELFSLVFCTLQWGYGDLFNRWVHNVIH